MSDNKDLGTTAKRLAKVGVAVGGVAARVAGEKYKNFLMAGGAITYDEFTNIFDLDASKPTLWKNSLETINDCITELEEYL